MYLSNATYTTCDLEHPHFNILATKIKMVNGKNEMVKKLLTTFSQKLLCGWSDKREN